MPGKIHNKNLNCVGNTNSGRCRQFWFPWSKVNVRSRPLLWHAGTV